MTHARMFAVAALTALLATSARAQNEDWSKVDAALGKTGALQADGVHKYGFPRSDLSVTLDGVKIKPALALGGWLAFTPRLQDTMVMGDLVLTESEVNPVMAKLLTSGIDVTAVHNHLLRANPETFYMHVEGHGDAVKLATAIRAALGESKTPFSAPTTGAAPAQQAVDLDTGKLDSIMGVKGKANGGVYAFSVRRSDPITAGGMTIPTSMGVAHGINFQPTGGGKAAITGDFIVLGSEVNPLIRTLRGNGIEVTAIHTHMLNEQPHMFFVHFWANDDAVKLAQGVRAALDKTASAKAETK
ncbi:MAG TPA: DUF1259 domain-containing protein [Pseudolabrys sp.]|nr:DUF1259 domain-containing protein [Pseudolabrys sp.]